MSIVAGFDCTHANIDKLPHGVQAAGYTTGSSGIAWTPADWKAHPGAVRIDQDASASDPTADVLDVENFAATPGDCPGWVTRAIRDFRAGRRPGQRWPAIYVNGSNITAVANALSAAKITGIGLWLAKPGEGKPVAIDQVNNASGPYPLIGVQFSFGQFMDADIWSSSWLSRVSTSGPVQHKTDGKMSITEIAATRNMNAGGWMMLQQELGGVPLANALGEAIPPAGRAWVSKT